MRRDSSFIAISFAVALASCATTIEAPPDIEPERLLPPDSIAYARLDGPTLAAALSLAPGASQADRRAAAAISERTDSLTLAIADSGGRIGMLGVAEGRYPRGAATLGLSTDKSWKRSGGIWEMKDGSMRLAFVSGGRAFVGTEPLDGLISAAESPNPYPIPARWEEEWSNSVSVYLPEPYAILKDKLPLGDGDIPIVGLLMAAKPAGGGSYLASLRFEFGSTRAATVFSPLCRLFLYAAAHSLWPNRAATVLDAARWTVSGTTVSAEGLPLDAESLGSFAAAAF